MAGKLFLLNGFPIGAVLQSKYRNLAWEFQEITAEKLRELAKGKEVINAIRHESTWRALLEYLNEAERIEFVQLVDFDKIEKDDIIVIVVPKRVIKRGEEIKVSIEDLMIIRVIGLTYYVNIDCVDYIFLERW